MVIGEEREAILVELWVVGVVVVVVVVMAMAMIKMMNNR